MSGAGQFWWPLALFPLAAMFCFYLGYRYWQIAHSIGDTATARVRSAPQGYVELYGCAEFTPNTTQQAPLSGRPCVWWSYRIEHRRSDGYAQRWQTINSGASTAPFLLRDATAACLVDTRGAQIKPSESSTWYGALPWPTAGMAAGSAMLSLLDQYRYIEHRLYQYDSVCALGEFRAVGGLASGNLDTDVAALLHHWKEDPTALLKRFDTDGNGVLSPNEWEQARTARASKYWRARHRHPH